MLLVFSLIAGLFLISLIVGFIIDDMGELLIIIGVIGLLLIGILGFGLLANVIPQYTVSYKIPIYKIETHIFKNGIIVSTFNDDTYTFRELKNYNAIQNIDYYKYVQEFNSYGGITSTNLYPIGKNNAGL